MRTVLCVWALLVLSAPSVIAQTITTGPVPVDAKFAWEAPANVTTAAQASTFEPRLYIDNIPATALTQVTCTTTATGITCSSPTTASNRDALNLIGSHLMTLSLFRADVGEGEKSTPFTLTSKAGAPTGLRLTR